MTARRPLAIGLTVLWLANAGSLAAHHSVASYYDMSTTTTITGTVSKVEWRNPHIFIFVDVKAPDGSVVTWALEGQSANSLYREGYRKDLFKYGDVVTVVLNPGVREPNQGHYQTISMDGKVVLALTGGAGGRGAANN
jgi:hypothetical protein